MTAVNLRALLQIIYFSRKNFSLAASISQKCAFKGEKKPCNFDFVVVGGGILGLATAREVLARHPYLKLAVLEKECEIATHQSGRHPGLIHTGLLCNPCSPLPKLCMRGSKLLNDFCERVSIPIKRSGKMIVATNGSEDERLELIIANAFQYKIPKIRILNGTCNIKEVEPNACGTRALYIPNVGSVDYSGVVLQLVEEIQCRGGRIFMPFGVEGFAINCCDDYCERRKFPVCIFGQHRSINASYAVVCCGIFSDRLARMTDCDKSPMNFSMRGHYLRLNRTAKHLVKGNIYRVPDPRFPHLGPNITRRYDGSVWLGPNIIPASKREGYKIFNISFRDIFEMLTYRGFWELTPGLFGRGFQGVNKKFCVKKFVKDFHNYLPLLTSDHVAKMQCPIVFPMSVNSDGRLLNDVYLERASSGNTSVPEVTTRVLHCRTVPEPAATMSMAIAEMIADRVDLVFFEKKARSECDYRKL